MEKIDHCPDHGTPERPWANCAGEEELTCPHFAAEIDRRVDEVQIKGNFVRTWKDDDGTRWRQEYRNHQPTGEPEAYYRRPA